MTKQKISIDQIRTDSGAQIRESLDQDTVDNYATILANGGQLPPIIAYDDGKNLWLGDGFHRLAAHKQAGRDQIEVKVRSGSKSDAQWYATTANSRHGLPLRRSDKRRAVEVVLRHPSGQGLSDRAIAKRVGVDHKTVGKVRSGLRASGEIPQSVQEVLANLPELSPDVMLSSTGDGRDWLVEIHPCPALRGYYFTVFYRLSGVDGRPYVEYGRRPGRYTREMLAVWLAELCRVNPTFWKTSPATGVIPEPVLLHDEQAR